MQVGIDYSINSPGVCVKTEDSLEFISLARIGVASESFFETLTSFGIKVYNSQPLKNSSTVLESSRESTLDAFLLAEKTVQSIIDANKGKGDREKNVVAIEGFSFGSSGNRLVQLAGYQYVLRIQALSHIISPVTIENMWIFAPSTVKSTAGAAGKGKGKKDMIQAFLEDTTPIPGLVDHPFYKEITTHPETFQTKRGKWIKPIDDIIDSYWILKTYYTKTQK